MRGKCVTLARLAVVLLAGTCLSPIGVAAQTWVGGTGTNFNTGTNWDTGTPPNAVQTGTFDASPNTSVSLTTSGTVVGGIQFTAAASAYTFDVNLGGGAMTVTSAGITNLSSNIQTFSLTDTGNFTVTGGTSNDVAFNLNDSTLRFAGAANLGNATVSLTNGSTLLFQQTGSGGSAAVTSTGATSIFLSLLSSAGTTLGSIAGSTDVDLGSKALTVGGNGATTTLTGSIGGTGGSIVKEGSGTWTLTSVASNYTGGTTINGGVISISSDANLGAAAGTLALDGGTLQTTASLTTSRATALNGGGGTFDTAASTTLTHSGTIGGTGALTKTGAGILTLSGSDSHSGATSILAGTLSGALSNSSAYTVATGATLDVTVILSFIGSLAGAGNVTLGASLFAGGDNSSTTFSGVLSGARNFNKSGSGTLTLSGANTYTGDTGVFGGTLRAGATNVVTSVGNLFLSFGTTFDLNNFDQTIGSLESGAPTNVMLGTATLTVGTNNIDRSFAGTISGTGGLTKVGIGTMTLRGANTYTGATSVNGGTLRADAAGTFATGSAFTLAAGSLLNLSGFNQTIGSLAGAGNTSLGTATLTTGGDNSSTTYSGVISGNGGLTKQGTGTMTLTAANTYSGGTTISAGTLQIGNGGATGSITGNVTNNATLAFNRSDSVTFSGAISGSGAVTKLGTGTLTLTNTNAYTGATTISAGTLQAGAANTFSSGSAHTVGAGSVLDLNNFNQTVGSLAGAGNVALGSATLTAGGDNTSTTFSGDLSGTWGSLTKTGTGTMTLSGANTYTGATTVNAGGLVVNGSLASAVTLNGGTLGGSGTIGGLTANGGILAPGNSIGTLNINGSFVQNGGVYQVEVNAQGQSDRINVTGAPGTATINGGTVQVIAAQGSYARSTTYTILNATGGVTGTYSNLTSDFAFLTPTLSYDANNVFLTLFQSSSAFASGAQTANQFAVGTALDRANATATGDFNTVLNALSSLNTVQGPAALDAISGQQYSGFGNANVASGLAFMSVLGQQMSLARGGSGGGTRVALAQACGVACDGEGEQPSGFSVWGSALGGTGSVAGSGNGNNSTLTYNLGGFAAGLDYRFDPRFLVGLGLGYGSGNQWVGGFNSRGTSTSYNASLYASFTPGAFYIDALAGYGYNDNQMTRMIAIPGLASRTTMGRTGANQFTGQAEAGYKFDIYAPAAASLTPFARFQTMSVSQNAFTETGADSLNLSVAQQTTTSVRTVLGAELAGGLDMGWREKLALQLRLGWAHEYADTSRPVTAAFAGAPGIGFTVYGAPPQRDGAVIGLAANTAIAQSTSIYLRYDGELGTGTDNHVLSAGLRMSW